MPRPARPWFRFYSESIDNAKLQRLDGEHFKLYMNLLCIANQATPRGQLPRVADIAFRLRIDVQPLLKQMQELRRCKLLDGPWTAYRIHDWAEWQPDSDAFGTPGRKDRHAVGTPLERGRNAVGTHRGEEIRDRGDKEIEGEAPKRRRPLSAIEAELPDLEQSFPDVNIDGELAKFMDYLKAKNKKYTDYVAAFRNWLRNAQSYQQERNSNGRIQTFGRNVGRGAGVTPTTADITAGWELEAARKG
jgi:hypothetical protein